MTKPQLPQGFDFTDPDVYATRLPAERLRSGWLNGIKHWQVAYN